MGSGAHAVPANTTPDDTGAKAAIAPGPATGSAVYAQGLTSAKVVNTKATSQTVTIPEAAGRHAAVIDDEVGNEPARETTLASDQVELGPFATVLLIPWRNATERDGGPHHGDKTGRQSFFDILLPQMPIACSGCNMPQSSSVRSRVCRFYSSSVKTPQGAAIFSLVVAGWLVGVQILNWFNDRWAPNTKVHGCSRSVAYDARRTPIAGGTHYLP